MAVDGQDYEMNPPALVKQKDLDTCWACCLSALLDANMSPRRETEDALVKKYATTDTGGITIPQMEIVAKDYGYLFNSFPTAARARTTLTDKFVKERLIANGMLMAAWRIHDPAKPNEVFYHAQIVWGVYYMMSQDIGTERALLQTMNPANKKYELYPLFSIYASDNMPMFTCWPARSSS